MYSLWSLTQFSLAIALTLYLGLAELSARDDITDPDSKPSKEELAKKEIETKLRMRVSVDFKKTPFHQVIDDLRSWSGINIVVDKRALKEENISMVQPVKMKLDAVPLKSALRNILNPIGLTYVIEEKGLKITSLARTLTAGRECHDKEGHCRHIPSMIVESPIS